MAPILGIYASSNYQRVTPDNGAMFPIAMANVGSTGAANIEFTSIPQTYKHLQIRVIGRTNGTGNRVSTAVQFNGDTTSNYRWHALAGTGAVAVGEDAGSLVTFVRIGSSNIPKGDADANIFGVSVADILDYTNNVKNKVTRSLSGQDQNNANGRIALQSGLWLNTNAITSIKIYPDDGASWAQYTQIGLFGIKG